MTTSHIGRLFRESTAASIQQLSTDIAGGAPSDWGQYQQQVGIIRGLKLAVDLLDEIEKEN